MQKVRKIMGKEITKLIEQALSWNGYLEKKSNRDLDNFTANAGNKNYTCLPGTTNYIPARTSRGSPGAPCLCLRYLSRLSAWRPPGGSWAVICTTTARPEWPS